MHIKYSSIAQFYIIALVILVYSPHAKSIIWGSPSCNHFSCDCSPFRDERSIIIMACSLGRQGESILTLWYWLGKWARWVYIVGFVPRRKKSLSNLHKSFIDQLRMFSQDAWIFVSFVHVCEEKLRRALPILFLAIFQAWKKACLFMLWLVISG